MGVLGGIRGLLGGGADEMVVVAVFERRAGMGVSRIWE